MRPTARVTAAVLATTVIAAGLIAGSSGRPGAAASLLSAYPDCEAFRSGLLQQPTTALTSLVFVPLGIWMARDRRTPSPGTRSLLAATVISVGIGSFLAHAAATDWARTIDSLAIKAMLVAFIAVAAVREQNLHRLWLIWAGTTLGVFAVELALPETARPLLALLLAGAAALTIISTGPGGLPWVLGGLAIIGLGGVAWWLGRGGGALCAPNAVFQPHGMWHILAAAGIASVHEAYRSEAT